MLKNKGKQSIFSNKIRKYLLKNGMAFPLSLSIFLLAGCNNAPIEEHSDKVEYEYIPSFQRIMDSAQLTGCILVYDKMQNKYFTNDSSKAETGQLPASTFKIPNSIIGLETKVVEDDSTLFKWDGEKRYLTSWERDLIFRDAFQVSCVPCYQEIARNIGVTRMKDYLNKLNFGTMVVDSSNLHNFWLQGSSRISPLGQIAFLKKMYLNDLPISDRSLQLVKNIMLIDSIDGWTRRGKTGWSISNNKDNGWFVGYQVKDENTLFFAVNVEPLPDFQMDQFAAIRKEIAIEGIKEVIHLLGY